MNLPAAQDFVSFLTSPAFQSQLKTYLPTTDPGGPPFVADASPNLTVSGLPKNYTAKKPLTVKGTLVNAEPGYPALAGQSVFLDQIVAGQPLAVASAKTNSTGAYSIKYTPTSSGSYEVSTGQISMIENSTLNPVYGDILSPSSTSPVNVTVHAATSNFKVESQGGKALVLGTVGPEYRDTSRERSPCSLAPWASMARSRRSRPSAWPRTRATSRSWRRSLRAIGT